MSIEWDKRTYENFIHSMVVSNKRNEFDGYIVIQK